MIFISRDVQFCEHICPFSNLQLDSKLFFPISSFTPDSSIDSATLHIPSSSSSSSPQSYASFSPSFLLVSPPPSTPIIRKSNRESKRLAYLNDFVYNHVFLTNISDTCLAQPAHSSTFSFGALSLQNQHLLGSISAYSEPTSFKQASLDPNWQFAMQKEIIALEENNT